MGQKMGRAAPPPFGEGSWAPNGRQNDRGSGKVTDGSIFDRVHPGRALPLSSLSYSTTSEQFILTSDTIWLYQMTLGSKDVWRSL